MKMRKRMIMVSRDFQPWKNKKALSKSSKMIKISHRMIKWVFKNLIKRELTKLIR